MLSAEHSNITPPTLPEFTEKLKEKPIFHSFTLSELQYFYPNQTTTLYNDKDQKRKAREALTPQALGYVLDNHYKPIPVLLLELALLYNKVFQIPGPIKKLFLYIQKKV